MSWKYVDHDFKKCLSSYITSAHEKEIVIKSKKLLLEHLKKIEYYKDLDSSIIESLEKAETLFSFNFALDKIYDYANDNKIWIEL